MATRTISTKLAVQGESEYRASISRINSELKAMQSALKLTESQYQANANSMEALRAKGDSLKAVYDTQKKKVEELRRALENSKAAEERYAQQKADIQAKIEANNRALEKLKTTTGDTSKEEERLNKENEELQKQLANVDAKMQAAEKGTNSWQTQLNNAEIQLNNLDAEIQKNDKYMAEAERAADGCATSIDEFGREVDDTAESVKGLGTILASQELSRFSEELKEALADCVEAYSDFEVGMAGVRRTTGLTGEDLDELGTYFRELSTEIPITTKELAAIATTAGQLGITGKANVQVFTETMAKLATTTDLTAETAATMLAQFSNITGEDDYARLGAVVASLGDATATTATKVVEMSQGIAATGNLAGMSATDIMAISAAVGSLGIESAAGSTAMSTLISTLYKATQTGSKLSDFASVAGMSAAEFKRSWNSDAVGTLDRFIQGLNDTERNGKSAIVLLDELGITNVRQTKAILGLASAEGLLTGTIAQANAAWSENTALSDKAAIMFDTMQAKMTTLNSATNNLKIAIGEALAPAIIDLADGGQTVIEGITEFVEKHPTLTEALTLTASGIVAITTATAGAKAAYKALDFLGMAKPLKEIAAAAAGAGGGISGLVAALGTIALPAAVAATALAGVVAIVDEINTVKTVGFLGEGHTLEEYAGNVDHYRAEIERLQVEYDNLANCGADLTMIQNDLDHATIGLSHAQEELAAAEEAAAQAAETAAEATDSYTAAENAAEIAADEIQMSLAEIAEAYQTTYAECQKSLEGQIGLFDAYAAEISEDTNSAEKMLDLWSQQTANLASYTENLKKAAQYGLDQGLVASLSDGSVQSAGYLATIIGEIESCAEGTGALGTSAQEAVAQFNAAFAQTEEAKNNLAATMAAMQTGLSDAIAALEEEAASVNFDGFNEAVTTAFSNVGVDFESIGINLGAGLASGISSSTPSATSAATDMANATNDAGRAAFGVRSPSTVWKEIGSNLDAGLVIGIESGKSNVTSAVSSMGQSVNDLMRTYGSRSTQSFIVYFRQLTGEMSSVMASLHGAAISGLAGLDTNMFIIGNNAVVGMINGIYSRSGNLYNAMYLVTTQAINAARRAAAVHSPSKKTQEIFENVGEGMIVGIESKRQKVAESTRSVVNEALMIDQNAIRAMSKTISAAIPDYSSLIGGQRERADTARADQDKEHGKTVNNNFDFHITTQPGQNPKEIAEAVMERIQIEFEKRMDELT